MFGRDTGRNRDRDQPDRALRTCRHRSRDERGAALIETAILIPVVILITFGLIEFSSAYQSSAVAASTARSAARTASAEAMLASYSTDAARTSVSAGRAVP
jgi:Flp pilus assembly protein TadG